MDFDDWMLTKDPKYYPTDDTVALCRLRECWNDAQHFMLEALAEIVDVLAGDYDSEEEARNECLSFCGYGRSIREVKPGDDGYKNPRQPKLTERRIPIYAAAGAAPKEPT